MKMTQNFTRRSRSSPSSSSYKYLALILFLWNGLTLFYVYFFYSGFSHHDVWVTSSSQPFLAFNENKDSMNNSAADADASDNLSHLIIVAGHSVLVSGHLHDADIDEHDWYLLDFQKGKGLPQSIVAHVTEGIRQAAMDPQSLLVFSGGETRATTGPVNEGTSYFRVADAMNLWSNNHRDSLKNSNDSSNTVRARTTTEEFATDSFQNLLFSMCRFHEVTGHYPTKITVVSFSFKQHRFEQMHAAALRYPSSNFHYIGIDFPNDVDTRMTGFNLEEATRGEFNNAAKPFENDPYGCFTDVLKEKRKRRNPFHRTAPYPLSCPDMGDLLGWCGPELISENLVPW
eukprot:CAMPEP_0194121832 /NCGR_PEP_ID=MMETSP0150-20130528/48632_1 /TAXON_ID=122233 /ORGANISM="Chaetoceros debilis, Strain MM31A-1" /LENGTH=342 /DNA_ID=CAMNT_0038814457 /DNA_START=82 /DNA_END=1110 /DNA_ORIENTATION=+